MTPDVFTDAPAEPMLGLREARESISAVRALSNATIDVRPGEIPALVGENGAGKSTLVNILPGVHRQNTGSCEVRGEEAIVRSPADSLHL